jgi:hypothetical protein
MLLNGLRNLLSCVCVCSQDFALYPVLGKFNVVYAVLDPFCDCHFIHACVSKMIPSQEVFSIKEFTHSFLLDMGCMSCPSDHS